MKKVILILLALSLMGCQTIQDWTPQNTEPINRTYNLTNQTTQVIELPRTGLYVNKSLTNVFFFKSDGTCTFIVSPENETFLIDCGSGNYMDTIRKVKNLGYNNLDYLIATNPTKEN